MALTCLFLHCLSIFPLELNHKKVLKIGWKLYKIIQIICRHLNNTEDKNTQYKEMHMEKYVKSGEMK